MKHLSHKLAISLLATSVTLSSVNADRPLLDQGVVSFDYTTKNHIQKSPRQRLNDQKSIVQSFHSIETQLKKALIKGETAQEELLELTHVYKKLKSEFDALSEEAKELKIQNAALKIEQEEHNAEKKSTWQIFKN